MLRLSPSEAWSRFPTGVGFDPNRPNWHITSDMEPCETGGMEVCGALIYGTRKEAEAAIKAYNPEAETKPHPLKAITHVDVDKIVGDTYPVNIGGKVQLATHRGTYLLGSFCLPTKEAEELRDTFNEILEELA